MERHESRFRPGYRAARPVRRRLRAARRAALRAAQLPALESRAGQGGGAHAHPASALAEPARVTVHPDNTLRELAREFATEHITTAVVTSREEPGRLAGLIAVEDLLQGHLRDMVYERERERVLRPRMIPVVRRGPGLTPDTSPAAAGSGRNGDGDPHGSPGGNGAQTRETEST